MASCSVCGKKVSLWSECNVNGKSYCEACYKKQEAKIESPKQAKAMPDPEKERIIAKVKKGEDLTFSEEYKLMKGHSILRLFGPLGYAFFKIFSLQEQMDIYDKAHNKTPVL